MLNTNPQKLSEGFGEKADTFVDVNDVIDTIPSTDSISESEKVHFKLILIFNITIKY